jgi:hypothetical protein
LAGCTLVAHFVFQGFHRSQTVRIDAVSLNVRHSGRARQPIRASAGRRRIRAGAPRA